MSDIRLRTSGGLWTDGGLQLYTGADAVAQKLDLRLQLVRGEFYLDQRVGIPYFEQVWRKNPSITALQLIFRRAIEECPGVIELRELRIEVGTNREAEVFFTAQIDGEDTPRDFSIAFIF